MLLAGWLAPIKQLDPAAVQVAVILDQLDTPIHHHSCNFMLNGELWCAHTPACLPGFGPARIVIPGWLGPVVWCPAESRAAAQEPARSQERPSASKPVEDSLHECSPPRWQQALPLAAQGRAGRATACC